MRYPLALALLLLAATAFAQQPANTPRPPVNPDTPPPAHGQYAPPTPREDWGAPLVTVSQNENTWTLAGKNQTVTIDAKTFAMHVSAASTKWAFQPADVGTLLIRDSKL